MTRYGLSRSDEGAESGARVLCGSAIVLAAKVATVIFGLLVSVIVARVYGAETVGRLALLTALSTLLMLVGTAGARTSSVHFLTRGLVAKDYVALARSLRVIMLSVLAVSLGAAALAFTFRDSLAGIVLGSPALAWTIGLLALLLVFRALGEVLIEVSRVVSGTAIYAAMLSVPTLANVLSLVPVLWLDLPEGYVYIAYLASLAVTLPICTLVLLSPLRRLRAELTATGGEAPSITAFFTTSLPMAVSGFLTYLFPQISLLAVAMIEGAEAAGYFSIALKIATVPAFILFSVNSVSGPIFARMYQEDRMAELGAFSRTVTKQLFVIMALVIAVLAISASAILRLGFGAEFIAALPIVYVLLAAQLVLAAAGVTDFLMNMTGQQGALRNFLALAVILNIAASLILIPVMGFVGAALAYALGVLAWKGGSVAWVRRTLGIALLPVPGRG